MVSDGPRFETMARSMDRLLFISSAGEDRPLVNAFCQRARRFMLNTWRDEEIQAGELVWSTIDGGFERTHIALAFVTEAAVSAARDPRRGLRR
jgi:hypothetical protein